MVCWRAGASEVPSSRQAAALKCRVRWTAWPSTLADLMYPCAGNADTEVLAVGSAAAAAAAAESALAASDAVLAVTFAPLAVAVAPLQSVWASSCLNRFETARPRG